MIPHKILEGGRTVERVEEHPDFSEDQGVGGMC